MIHHLDIAVSDITLSESFYSSVLATLGLSLVSRNEHNSFGGVTIGFGSDSSPDPVFWIRSDSPVTVRVHIAFLAPTRAAVDAFHVAALRAGGVNNGYPGYRERYANGYYAAFALDPDGHNIEAVYRHD